MEKKLSRRHFLRSAALAAAGAAAAACAPKTVVVEKEKVVTQVVKETVKETVIVEGEAQVVEKEVTKVIEVEKVITATPPPAEPAKVIIFVGFGTGTAAEQIEVHEAIAEEYNAQSDGMITVEFLTVPWEEHQAKFFTMLAADTPPDVCMPIGVGGVTEGFDAWLDISPYIEADKYDMGQFFGMASELHSYPGKGLLGLPVGVFPMVIFYNEDLFDAAGLDYPPHKVGDPYPDGDDWTYAKLVEVAKQLTLDKNGNNADSPAFNWEETVQWGWNGWDWNTFMQWPEKWGGNNTGVSEDHKTALMNSEPWVQAMEFNKDCWWTWRIRATGEQAGAFYDVAGDPMGSGMVGMWECHSWMQWAYPSWTETFNWDVAAVPAVEGYDVCAPIHADGFTMVQAAHHKDQAWQVMKWMFQSDILDRLCRNYGAIPAHIELAANWVPTQVEQFGEIDFEVFIDAIPYADDPQHEKWIPQYSRISEEVDTAEGQISSGENLNVQEVMDTLQANAQALLDEYWASQ